MLYQVLGVSQTTAILLLDCSVVRVVSASSENRKKKKKMILSHMLREPKTQVCSQAKEW